MRRLYGAVVVAIIVGCGGRAEPSLVGERVASKDGVGWSVPEHQCDIGAVHTEVGEDGTVSQACHVDGELVGPFVKWYPSGVKAAAGSYWKGKQHGPWAWWHANGQMSARGEYAEGDEAGVWTWWYANGERETTGDHLDGRRAGLWRSWYPTGTLKAQGHYRNGHKDGAWKYWTDEGEVDFEEEWDLGKKLRTTEKPNRGSR